MDKQHNQDQHQLEGVLPGLSHRKSSTNFLCDICFQSYHIMGRWPMLACTNGHFFCDHCIEGMFKLNANQPVPCPICRQLIRYSLVKPHYQLFRTINKQTTVKQALQSQQNELFLYAFQHQIFEVAGAFKSKQPETIKKFTKLDCSSRKISKIEHMQSFPALVYLRLDCNSIAVPSGLQCLSNLRFLNLSHNHIQDISLLGNLKKLAHLAVEYNQINEIQSLLPFSKLSHFFLLGNPLKGIIIDELLLVQFKNLLSVSISTTLKDQQKVIEVFLQGVNLCGTMPKLNKIFVKDIVSSYRKRQLQERLKHKAAIEWVSINNKQAHSNWINEFMNQCHQYGEVFQFKPDPASPSLQHYQHLNQTLTKLSNNFVILNSEHSMQKQGKINFKVRIPTPSQHVIIGLCNGFLKHDPNIYSEHFVGLTLWGSIYVRGEYLNITGKLRLEDKPAIRMSVDFQNEQIRWFSDDVEIGLAPFPQQFKHSSLYFVVGMRDPQTSVVFLTE